MDLEELRKEIDQIDNELINLFIKRMNCSKQVGLYKKEHGLPILNPAREQEILNSVKEKGEPYGFAAQQLFSNIMELSRALQHDIVSSGQALRNLIETAPRALPENTKAINIACQGIKGANAHEAAVSLFSKGSCMFCNTFADVCGAIENGNADYGVLPVENSSAGSVADVFDLLLRNRFHIVNSLNLPIHHCLCSLPQCNIKDIEEVWSHPQALAQSTEFIEQHKLKAVPATNTAVAAKSVANENRLNLAAICSKQAANIYGLNILKENIENSKNNSTRFIVISKRPCIPKAADKISLCFSLPHVTGSLYNILSRFSFCGLNLTKIESRPKANAPFEYLFYLDFNGNVQNEQVRNLLCALSEELPDFFFLGNYKEL